VGVARNSDVRRRSGLRIVGCTERRVQGLRSGSEVRRQRGWHTEEPIEPAPTEKELGRPAREHSRGSRPRPSPGPTSGPAAARRKKQPNRSADRPALAPCARVAREGAPMQPFVPENMAWMALHRSGRRPSPPERCGGIRSWKEQRLEGLPRRIGEIARVGGARLRADDGRNGGIKTRSDQGRCPRAWRDPWRAATPSQTHSSRRKTLSVSLQRMTCGPLRGRGPGSGGWAKHQPLRLSPSQGRKRGVFRRRDSAIPPPVDRSSVCGRTSCFSRSHTLSLVSAHHYWSPIPSFRNARTRESQNRRGPMIRGPDGGECRCRSECRVARVAPHPTGFDRFVAGQNGYVLALSRKDACTE